MKVLNDDIVKVKPLQEEIRTIPKTKEPLASFIIPPGCKLYEMVLISVNPEDPIDVQGMNRETGDFDPELALVREVSYKTITTSLENPDINLIPVPMITADGAEVVAMGKINRGSRREVNIIDGNIYEVSASIPAARRKIIRKYFKPLIKTI